MRSSRAFGGLVVALALVAAACGSSSGTAEPAKPAKAANSSHSDTAGEHDMRCMETKFAGKNPKVCATTTEAKPFTLATPLTYTPDGLVDISKVDLSGVQGVTPKQTQDATELLKATVKTLPRWSDPAVAAADGFQSIGDGLTGEEHMLHWDWIDDDVIFDPNKPESLVYKVDRATGARTLEAAMYILPKQYSLENPHPLESPLVQFHHHDNLCFTPPAGDKGPQVRGLTDAQGNCAAPLTKFNPNIQVHVWIRANECGPFASLLGVGAGQIANGSERSCVKDHNQLGL